MVDVGVTARVRVPLPAGNPRQSAAGCRHATQDVKLLFSIFRHISSEHKLQSARVNWSRVGFRRNVNNVGKRFPFFRWNDIYMVAQKSRELVRKVRFNDPSDTFQGRHLLKRAAIILYKSCQ